MWPHAVVESDEFIQERLQGVHAGRLNLLEQRLQRSKHPFNPPVTPRLHGWPAPVSDAQRLQNTSPQLTCKYSFVIGSNHLGHAKARKRETQATQQSESALAGQHLQAKQPAKAVIHDAQHSESQAIRTGHKSQIQCPGMATAKTVGLRLRMARR